MLPAVFPVWLSSAFDIPLVITVHVAITRGKLTGMAGGLLLGYSQDALAAGILGVNGLSKIAAGYTGGLLKEKFFVRSLTNRLIAVLGAVVIATFSKLIILFLFAMPAPPFLSLPFLLAFFTNTALALFGSSALERVEVRIGLRKEEEIHLEG